MKVLKDEVLIELQFNWKGYSYTAVAITST